VWRITSPSWMSSRGRAHALTLSACDHDIGVEYDSRARAVGVEIPAQSSSDSRMIAEYYPEGSTPELLAIAAKARDHAHSGSGSRGRRALPGRRAVDDDVPEPVDSADEPGRDDGSRGMPMTAGPAIGRPRGAGADRDTESALVVAPGRPTQDDLGIAGVAARIAVALLAYAHCNPRSGRRRHCGC